MNSILSVFVLKPLVYGDQKGTNSIKEVGKLIPGKIKKRRCSSFLRQSISMEIQRGNCASILGSLESPKLLEKLFDTKSDH